MSSQSEQESSLYIYIYMQLFLFYVLLKSRQIGTRPRASALYGIGTVICRVLSNVCHRFLATLYLSKLSLVNCLALIQVPVSSALYALM